MAFVGVNPTDPFQMLLNQARLMQARAYPMALPPGGPIREQSNPRIVSREGPGPGGRPSPQDRPTTTPSRSGGRPGSRPSTGVVGANPGQAGLITDRTPPTRTSGGDNIRMGTNAGAPGPTAPPTPPPVLDPNGAQVLGPQAPPANTGGGIGDFPLSPEQAPHMDPNWTPRTLAPGQPVDPLAALLQLFAGGVNPQQLILQQLASIFGGRIGPT